MLGAQCGERSMEFDHDRSPATVLPALGFALAAVPELFADIGTASVIEGTPQSALLAQAYRRVPAQSRITTCKAQTAFGFIVHGHALAASLPSVPHGAVGHHAVPADAVGASHARSRGH